MLNTGEFYMGEPRKGGGSLYGGVFLEGGGNSYEGEWGERVILRGKRVLCTETPFYCISF